MRTGALNDEDWHRLTNAVGRLNEAPILIDETLHENVKPEQIAGLLEAAKKHSAHH